MNYKKRYYNCPELFEIHDLRDVIRKAAKDYGDMSAYRQFESRILESAISFKGLSNNIDALGTALLSLGQKGKHIAILGETSIEWITSYFAIICGVGVAVPVDRDLIDDTLAYQLCFGDVNTIICSGKCVKKLKAILPMCPGIDTVIIMRDKFSTVPLDESWLNFDKLIVNGRELLHAGDTSYTSAEIDPKAMIELIYTSGTTGANKGVMLSHENIWTCGIGARQLVHYKNTNMSVLPVHHTYELTCNIMSSIYEGSTVSINDDLKHVSQNINHFHPKMTCMVPAMLDLMVRKVRYEVKKSELEQYVNYSLKFSNLIRKFGIDRRKRYFKPILVKFGGKLDKIICGGSPLSNDTLDFLDSIGITVLNGYGITECAPLVAVNGDKLRRRGSVGHVLPSCKVRIANPDENGNGEIQVKGGNVMLGYYKNPEDTKEVFTEDGWFKTGDIGHLDKDNFLYINGRIKNLIILSNGKNVYPEEVEEHLQKEIPYVQEAVVFADEDNTGIYAICYLNPEFCKENGLTDVKKQHERIMQDIALYNKKAESYKRISNIQISDTEFEKTTTNKIKRFKVERNRQNV